MAKTLLPFIAVVMVTAFIDGVRREFQPGEELPELNPHDSEALLKMGAIRDPNAEAAEAKAEAKTKAAGEKEFQAARGKVLDAEASTKAPGGEAPTGA
jgi:hypothetical protein